jgi:hypothetical protein
MMMQMIVRECCGALALRTCANCVRLKSTGPKKGKRRKDDDARTRTTSFVCAALCVRVAERNLPLTLRVAANRVVEARTLQRAEVFF